MLQLTTLGATRLILVGPDGGEQVLLGPGKSVALLTYLASLPNRTAQRDHLVDLLWADAAPEQARRNLRQTIYQIRQRLGEGALETHGDAVTLAAEVTIDRNEFEQAVAAGDGAVAVARYTGPFFPAYAAPGGVAFEQWADLERRRLHHLYVRVLEALIREAVAQHRHQAARALWVLLREADPGREAARRLGLEVLISSGDWLEAAAEADALEAWAAERGRPLEPATAMLVRAARQVPAAPEPGEPSLVAEMVGRSAEFAAVLDAWGQASAGAFRHVHVLGAAGLGKTRLLQDAAARITALGGRVVYLKASQGERDLEYAVAADLARAAAQLPGAPGTGPGSAAVLIGLDPALAVRFPSARPATAEPGELLRLRVTAVADLVTSVADEAPLALFLDDLHWTDAASRQIVTGLAGRVGARPVLLVTSARPQAGGIEAGRPDETITLRALAVEDVGALVESVAHVPERLQVLGFYRALTEATGGSPLLVLQVLRLALDRGWLARAGDAWVVQDEAALLEQLREGSAVELRLASLAPHERRLLVMLAAAGIPVPGPVLEAATRRIDLGPAATLAELERAGFVAPRGEAWEPAHDVVAEKVILSATRDELRQAHATLGHSWAGDAGAGRDALAAAARFLARAGDAAETARMFGRYERWCRREGDWRHPRALAAEVLGAEHAALVPQMVRALGPVRRWRLHAPSRSIPIAAVLVAAAVAPFAWSALVPQPYALAIVRAPEIATWIAQPFGVRVVDRRGRSVERYRDTVRVTVGMGHESWLATGTVAAVPIQGVAWFDSIVPAPTHAETTEPAKVDSTGWAITLRAEAPGLVPIETDSVFLGGGSFLRVESGALNGQWLTGDSLRVVTEPGAMVVGHLNVAYRVIAGGAAVVAAGIPVWGDRRETYFPLHAMRADHRLVQERWAIRFQAPERPGRYLLFIVGDFETAAEFIASGTNWALRKPIWFDGNDVVDIAPPQEDLVRRTGQMRLRPIVPDMGFAELLTPAEIEAAVREGRVAQGSGRKPAAVIEVVVGGG
jgi:DNA-binding SARP family transcriptional activator